MDTEKERVKYREMRRVYNSCADDMYSCSCCNLSQSDHNAAIIRRSSLNITRSFSEYVIVWRGHGQRTLIDIRGLYDYTTQCLVLCTGRSICFRQCRPIHTACITALTDLHVRQANGNGRQRKQLRLYTPNYE